MVHNLYKNACKVSWRTDAWNWLSLSGWEMTFEYIKTVIGAGIACLQINQGNALWRRVLVPVAVEVDEETITYLNREAPQCKLEEIIKFAKSGTGVVCVQPNKGNAPQRRTSKTDVGDLVIEFGERSKASTNRPAAPDSGR